MARCLVGRQGTADVCLGVGGVKPQLGCALSNPHSGTGRMEGLVHSRFFLATQVDSGWQTPSGLVDHLLAVDGSGLTDSTLTGRVRLCVGTRGGRPLAVIAVGGAGKLGMIHPVVPLAVIASHGDPAPHRHRARVGSCNFLFPRVENQP
jgi:hypothetical protein